MSMHADWKESAHLPACRSVRVDSCMHLPLPIARFLILSS